MTASLEPLISEPRVWLDPPNGIMTQFFPDFDLKMKHYHSAPRLRAFQQAVSHNLCETRHAKQRRIYSILLQ
jgi:hypothetical protein